MVVSFVCLVAASCASGQVSPDAPVERLSLSDAIHMARRQNPAEAVARYSEESAAKYLASQRSPINPTLNYSGLNNSVAAFGGFGNRANYNTYVTLETSGHWRYRTDAARWQLAAAKASTDGADLGVVQAVTDAYINLQVSQSDLKSEEQAWRVAKKLAELADSQFKLGAQPQSAAIRAQIAFAQEEQNLANAKAACELARANLSNTLGSAAKLNVEAADPLVFTPMHFDEARTIALALSHRYEVRAGESTTKSLEATVGLTRADYFPDTILGADLQNRQVQIGITIPVDLGSIRGAVQKAQADVKVQKAQNEKQRQQVMLDVRTALLALESAQTVVESYGTEIVPRADNLQSRVIQGFALGASTILEVIDAQETLRTAQLAYNDAVGNFRHGLNQLQVSVGVPLSDIPHELQGGKR